MNIDEFRKLIQLKLKENKDLEFGEMFNRMSVSGKILPNNCCFDPEVTESLLPMSEDLHIEATRIQHVYDQIEHIFEKDEMLVIFGITGYVQGVLSGMNGLNAREGIHLIRQGFNVSDNGFIVITYMDINVNGIRTCAFVRFAIPKPTFN
jgi:hypothetical protein